MKRRSLRPTAWMVLALNAIYNVADALCSVFVGVYFYVTSLDFEVVIYHYLTLYLVTPVFFLLAGWYSQARDRVHVFRAGLFLHAVFYATLLWLREDAANHPVALGALLGVTWGLFWAGNNVFPFDVTAPEERDYFFGWLSAITGIARLTAPLLAGFIIYWAPDARSGYEIIFFVSVLLYLAAIVLSFRVPPDSTRRRYHIWRALFPRKDQRDWQWMMLAGMTMAGSFHIFYFLLGLLLYMQTANEVSVGAFTAFQGFAGITTAYMVGRYVTPHTRIRIMRWGVALLLCAGMLIAWRYDLTTLIIFGFLQAVAMPLFAVPHSSLRFDVIDKCARHPLERIEYISAWEVPLAMGRVFMMGLLVILYAWDNEWGLRIVLFLLCANRLWTYLLIRNVSALHVAR